MARSSRHPIALLVLVFGLILVGCGTDETLAEEADDVGTETADEAAVTDTETDTDTETGTETDTDTETDTETEADVNDGEVEELFPDVLGATAALAEDGSWTFSATLSSTYDTPQRYADAWRVVGPDGEVYGERILTHDHQNEQPFTRSTSGVVIPDDVEQVTIQGRDQISGWGGGTTTVDLER